MKTARLSLIATLVASLSFGCANMDDPSRTQAEGAGIGALLGAVVGYAVSGDGKGAAIGAAVGGGLGLLVGNEVAKRKQAYASTEEFLDAEIARTDEFNATAVAYNKKLNTEVAALEKETKTLRARYDSGKVKKEVLVAKRTDLQKRIDDSNKLEQTLAKELEVQNAILAEERGSRPAGDAHLARLEMEVAELQKNLDKLREGSSQLARIDQRLSV